MKGRRKDAEASATPFLQISQQRNRTGSSPRKTTDWADVGVQALRYGGVTISGFELAARIRKHQFKLGKVPGFPITVSGIWAAVLAA